jgi:DMSO reductase anchor subunit
MNPAFSVVLFTTISGAAQGLVVALALARLIGVTWSPNFGSMALLVAEAMLLTGLGASFAHLGRPERAWRAVLMWRTSWLSREVIVLPAFIGVTGLWWLVLSAGIDTVLLPVAAIALAIALWYCTAMIYACLRFIQEWAQPLTLVNFTLMGLSSGLVLISALAAWWGETHLMGAAGPAALGATVLAWVTRAMALRRNASLTHKSSLQSATGIRATKLVQKSMGMSAGSFNTREFFHKAGQAALRRVRLGMFAFGFALPSALLFWGIAGSQPLLFALAWGVQVPGLLGDRWFFFAQARHPQNLYYQVVS